MRRRFAHIATLTSIAIGHYLAFLIATLACLVWALSGPFFGFSSTWQLVINTATTVLTFLIVFLIQNTQNRETKAVQRKLDELIRAIDQADNRMMRIEHDVDALEE